MPNIGDTVGVQVADPFNPDAEPDIRPGLVVNVESDDNDGREGPDVVTVVVFAKDGSQSVQQVSEGAGLASLGYADDAVTADAEPVGTDGQADTDTVGDGTNPRGFGSTDTGPGNISPSSFGNTH